MVIRWLWTGRHQSRRGRWPPSRQGCEASVYLSLSRQEREMEEYLSLPLPGEERVSAEDPSPPPGEEREAADEPSPPPGQEREVADEPLPPPGQESEAADKPSPPPGQEREVADEPLPLPRQELEAAVCLFPPPGQEREAAVESSPLPERERGVAEESASPRSRRQKGAKRVPKKELEDEDSNLQGKGTQKLEAPGGDTNRVGLITGRGNSQSLSKSQSGSRSYKFRYSSKSEKSGSKRICGGERVMVGT
ncbi:protein TsetseEP-like [Syngnathoides biaculeatus]|uniref:protein TsetseEP-like n=1 Tax=Syngnathoides biaculeatus TaxID=300417 RepID=UPI002ADD6422|nr:protein TsetseEP-like [Syngnathoides biaculeatus]